MSCRNCGAPPGRGCCRHCGSNTGTQPIVASLRRTERRNPLNAGLRLVCIAMIKAGTFLRR